MDLWDIVVIAAALFSPNSHEEENGYTYAVGQFEQSRSNEITENIDDIFSLAFPNRGAAIEGDFAEERNDPTNVDGQVKRSRSKEITDTVDQIFNPVLANRMGEPNVAYPNVATNGHNSVGGRVKKSGSRETDANMDGIFSPVLANRIAATKVAPKADVSRYTIIRIRQNRPRKPVKNASRIIKYGSANGTSEIGIANASTANRPLGPSDYGFQMWLNDTLNDRGRSYTLLRLSRHRIYLLMKMFNISDVLSCTPKQPTNETDLRAVNYSCSFSIYHMELEVIYQIHNMERQRKLQTIYMENVDCQAIIKSDNGTLQMVAISLGDKYEKMIHSQFISFIPGLLGSYTLGEREKGFIFYLALNSDGDTTSLVCCDTDGFIHFERLGDV